MRIKKLLYVLPVFIFFAVTPFLRQSAPSASQYSLSDADYVSTTISIIQKEYPDRERIKPREMLEGALDEIQRKIPEILAQFDDLGTLTLTVDMASKRFSANDADSIWKMKKLLAEILAFIDVNYSGDTEKQEIEYAAIEGLLSPLDPHSSFLPPKVYSEFKIGTRGEFGGLGIVVNLKDGILTVVAPLDDTPASRAGIKSGDHIVQIDDESSINMSLTDAVNKLRGQVGTKVKIVIERPGREDRLSFNLTRAIINIESVQHAIIEEHGKHIAYLKIKNFQANTDDDVEAAFEDFAAKGVGVDGLILDLRNNPGGLLNQAVMLADRFLSKGTIVSTVGAPGSVLDKDVAHEDAQDVACPIAVLINEGSASASEIVAGAIKELGRGITIGSRSFGKGSVQTIFEIGREAALKLTIAKYLPAGTYNIQSIGLSPDVELVPVTLDKKDPNLVEDEPINETSLEKHLKQEGTVEPPAYRIRFLKPKEESDESKTTEEYSKEPKIKDDFAVNLASGMLAEVQSRKRKTMLDEIKQVAAEKAALQEIKIVAGLKAIGLDWSLGALEGRPQLQVAFDIKKENLKLNRIAAGSEALLELKITNVGDGPFYRLIGVGKTRSFVLPNKEFVFGKLMPGETRSAIVPIKIPSAALSEEISMEISFQDENSSVPATVNAIVPIKGKTLPVFGFRYNISKAEGSSFFNLDMDIINKGEGPSGKDTTAQLINKSGENLFIEIGRATIGKIPPGQTRHAAFRFHLARDFKEKEVKFELAILDSMRIDAVSQNISLNTDTNTLSPSEKKMHVPPVIELQNAPLTTEEAVWHAKGTATAGEGIRDYVVFVNDKKVAYVSNPSKTANMQIDADCPLKPGKNIVVIAARNTEDIFGRSAFIIHRTTGKTTDAFEVLSMPTLPDLEE